MPKIYGPKLENDIKSVLKKFRTEADIDRVQLIDITNALKTNGYPYIARQTVQGYLLVLQSRGQIELVDNWYWRLKEN